MFSLCGRYAKRSEINILDKEPHQVRPNDFYDLNELELEYEGLFHLIIMKRIKFIILETLLKI